MRTRGKLTCLLIVGLLPLSSSGCIVVVGGWGWSDNPRVWTEPVTEDLPLDAADLRAVDFPHGLAQGLVKEPERLRRIPAVG